MSNIRWLKIFSDPIQMRNRIPEGTARLLLVAGKRVCLTLIHDCLYAVEDSCSHRRASLSKGILNYKCEIVCPLHGYQFNVKTGRECKERSPDLVTYLIKEDKNGVYIGL